MVGSAILRAEHHLWGSPR